ncbi:hypothetical protein, partial [uncultured Acetatifactor sp.]|uniref:hypothetical protein n=1 Tax=uncultured Acetatifactor sp. TaxID=1671927 RepID=UPI0026F39B5D
NLRKAAAGNLRKAAAGNLRKAAAGNLYIPAPSHRFRKAAFAPRIPKSPSPTACHAPEDELICP